MESLSAALDELYGGAIEPIVRKKGETQCVGFVASFLDDAFAPGGRAHPGARRGAAGGAAAPPPHCRTAFSAADYVAGERANLVDRIRAQINDKRSYATLRLGQLMCGEEAFGVDKLGDEEHAAAVTPERSVGAVSAAALHRPDRAVLLRFRRRGAGGRAP